MVQTFPLTTTAATPQLFQRLPVKQRMFETSCTFFSVSKTCFFSFDDAKVRRFSKPAMNHHPFSSKKGLSFDINQGSVCEHTPIVCENNTF
jgi:hypothetical protein